MRKLRSKMGQIAFSVTDHRATTAWYRDLFGFVDAGSDRFSGAIVDKIVGVGGVDMTAWWLIGRQDAFQLEFFRVSNPPARGRPRNWRPCDVGYTMLGIHVRDFDAMMERAEALSALALAPPLGAVGSRRICLADPDGVLVEIMENDPLPDLDQEADGPAVRFVTMSVPDLNVARRFAIDGLGLVEVEPGLLHDASHEALWGLAGAKRRQAVFSAGNVLLEIVQYEDPVGDAWPEGYRITDLGILNVAYLYAERWQLAQAFRAAVSAGLRPNMPDLVDLGPVLVMYGNDPQGFSIEFVQIGREHFSDTGFVSRPADERLQSSIEVSAPLSAVWSRIAALDRWADWTGGFQARLFREGRDGRCGVGAVIELYNDRQWILMEVVAWDLERKITFAVRSGFGTENHVVEWRLGPAAALGTIATVDVRYNIAGDGNDKFHQALSENLQADLTRLKKFCEEAHGFD